MNKNYGLIHQCQKIRQDNLEQRLLKAEVMSSAYNYNAATQVFFFFFYHVLSIHLNNYILLVHSLL